MRAGGMGSNPFRQQGIRADRLCGGRAGKPLPQGRQAAHDDAQGAHPLWRLHRNGIAPVVLRDVPFGGDYCKCAISRIRCRCSKCGHCQDQPVPFKGSGHMITRKLEEYTEALLEEGGTLKSAAEITGLGKNVVKEIDK